MTLLPVAEAQTRVLAMARPIGSECVPIADANGRYLAAPLVARRRQPAADLSAMDGYAIRFADLPGPWRVAGESRAGGIAGAIGTGEAARISTGAALPVGADTILIQEDAERTDDRLRLTGPGPEAPGAFVRRAGTDFPFDARLAADGARLTPALLGLAALAGNETLTVGRIPRVGLLSTGEEIANGALPDANFPMLAALLADDRIAPVALGVAGDSLAATCAALDSARQCDLVVTTGGVSVGDHDHVRAAFEEIGGTVDFWRIAMRPGKPLLAGRLGATVFLGLPGNPVSAFVTALLFAQPVVRQLAGAAAPLPIRGRARLGAPLAANGVRETYLRATFDGDDVVALPDQDSAATRMLARAAALIVRPIDAPAAACGDMVEIIRLG